MDCGWLRRIGGCQAMRTTSAALVPSHLHHTPARQYRIEPAAASSATNEGKPAVDTNVEAPYARFMNLQVLPELEAKLTRLAAETGRTADQVALDLLASSVDHDQWFRAEVEKGRSAAREGRLIEHDDLAARMDRRYRG